MAEKPENLFILVNIFFAWLQSGFLKELKGK